jgi:hypothetical protein
MSQLTALSSAHRSAIDASLRDMFGDAVGALATLPLFCLGEISIPEPRNIVLDHHARWRSHLVAARELANEDAGDSADILTLFDLMLRISDDLRDAFITIAASRGADAEAASAACARLVSAYKELFTVTGRLAGRLDLPLLSAALANTLRASSHNRTLQWLVREIRLRVRGAHANGVGA